LLHWSIPPESWIVGTFQQNVETQSSQRKDRSLESAK
jgi:hypothetical protein